MAKRSQPHADHPGKSSAQPKGEPKSVQNALGEGEQSALLQEALENLNQGISVFDSSLRLVAWNNKFLELLEFPPEFGELRRPFADFIRHNAERGEYGPGDVERLTAERVELAMRFEPHRFERTRPDGTVIEVVGNPMPGGGFATTYTDITETKTLVNALREKAWQLSKAQEMSKLGHWWLDAATLEVEGSDELFRIFGVGEDEATLEAFAAAVHPDDRENDLAHIRRGLEQGESWDIEHRLLDRDGNIKYVRAAGEATFTADGQVKSLFGTVHDLTERQRAEIALRESEERFHLLANSVPAVFTYLDSEHRYQYVNKVFGKWNGIDPEEAVGRYVTDILDPVVYEKYRPWIEKALSGEEVSFELYRTLPGTGARWVQCNYVPHFTSDGSVQGIVGLVTDITERKASEEALQEGESRYRSIFESAEVGLTRVRLSDGKLIEANERIVEILGYEDHEQMMAEFVPERHWADPSQREKMIAEGSEHGIIRDSEIEIVRRDGTKRWVRYSTTLFVDRDYLLAVTVDITEHRRAEEDLRLALIDAERANQAKSDFLATMSHELRTPLNAIIGFSDMIEGQLFGALGSEKYKEYAHDIHNSSEHLMALINDILDLSAIEAGQQSLVKEKLSVGEVADDCARIIVSAASEKNIEFSVDVPDDLPPLWADRRAVKQILFNLLTNAVKYTLEGGTILLKATATDEFHFLEVGDTGIGVPAEKLPTLTDPFVRSETDPHKPQEGSGLGLAIANSLVALHGGELNINSEIGVGTTVTVMLPNETT